MKLLLRFCAASFLTWGIVIQMFLVPISFGTSGETLIFHYVFFLLSILCFFKSFKYVDKAEPTTWVCETCHTESTRDQIKFGKCTICGNKIKSFRGMQSILIRH